MTHAPAKVSGLRVSVAAALPGRQEVIEVDLPEGSRVADAIEASGILERFPELREAATGIWSKPCARDAILREGDRVELYRPLIADAKEARRSRARRGS
jgi:putative ubiquitin-RnfH superfamily antitoxin RatB of RatAB toxin-antitoxin module